MTNQRIPLDAIRPNPWQTRTDPDGENLMALAEDIRAHGLLQPPTGRRLDDGTVQLAFGHRRLAAFVLLNQEMPEHGSAWDHMPIDIQDLTDRQMAEIAAAENSQRDDISAIDKAKAIQRLISDFKMSQAEAGKLFRINSQGAVSNLLRLLKLPDPVQDLIQHGILPERLARGLLSLAELNSKACERIARAVAEVEPDERDAQLYAELDRYVKVHGHSLNYTAWPLDWPPRPVPSGNVHVGDIPKCEGCSFNVRCDAGDPEDRGCIRKVCFGLKLKAWAEAEARRVAAEHKIRVAQKGEKPTIIFDGGSYEKAEEARRMLATKHESLRTIPTTDMDRTHYRDNVTGSRSVLLGSVDVRALRAAMKSPDVKAAPKPKPKLEKWEIQQEKREAEKRERAKQVRALLSNAAPAFAPVVPPVLQELLYRELRYDIGHSHQESERVWKKADANERGRLIAGALLRKHVGLESYCVPSVDAATKKIAGLAKAAHVKLPPGWDAAPEPPKLKSAPAKSPKRKKGNP